MSKLKSLDTEFSKALEKALNERLIGFSLESLTKKELVYTAKVVKKDIYVSTAFDRKDYAVEHIADCMISPLQRKLDNYDMNNYKPDYFTVVEFKSTDKPTTYKVFATWVGGFTRGDSWRLSTEIVRVEAKGQLLYFYGKSGSCYEVHKDTWGGTMWSNTILDSIVEKFNLSGVTTAEVLDRNTDWSQLEYV